MKNNLNAMPHLEQTGNRTDLIVDSKPFIMLAGEIHNSSSSSLKYMDPIWGRLVALNCNTAVVPVYWELIEPEEGKFDFALVNGLIVKAREHGLRLVLLWFATWKNGMSTYAPAWVKTRPDRFPRARYRDGANSMAISCLSDEACRADSRAFSALMGYIRGMDGEVGTVIAVQVENEVGLLGAERDFGPEAETAFMRDIPPELSGYLAGHAGELLPEVGEPWAGAGRRTAGNWKEVFGEAAEEVFMAWNYAIYVDRVAAAGKSQYPLPMYVNAWIVQHEGEKPGEYPSGGPVSRMFNIWKCAVENIDLLAPDIYLENFAEICASYSRCGNQLFIPEARRDETAAANVFYAIGQHGALCFSSFGIESVGLQSEPEIAGAVPAGAVGMVSASGDMLAKSYRLLDGMMPVLLKYRGTGKMAGVLQDKEDCQEIRLGGNILRIKFKQPLCKGLTPAAGLFIAVSDDEYIVAGHNFSVEFLPLPGQPGHVDYLYIEEGSYVGGGWVAGRRLNGDEYAVRLGTEPSVIHTALYRFP